MEWFAAVVGIVVITSLFKGLSFRSGLHIHNYTLTRSDYESVEHTCAHCKHRTVLVRHAKTVSGKIAAK